MVFCLIVGEEMTKYLEIPLLQLPMQPTYVAVV